MKALTAFTTHWSLSVNAREYPEARAVLADYVSHDRGPEPFLPKTLVEAILMELQDG